MLERKIRTPCIGVCSTGLGDTVCRGCKRFLHEVTDWNAYSEADRTAVDRRLEMLLTDIVSAKLRIIAPEQLQAALDSEGVRYLHHRNPYCRAFDLLRAGAGQIGDLSPFGIEVLAGFRELSPSELRDQIDQEFYILSEAHYERYFNIKVLNNA